MKVVATLILLAASSAFAQPANPPLRAYAYVSPSAAMVLKGAGLTEQALIDFADREAKARGIGAIDPNRNYEGSEDALRVDIRRQANALVIELSVRQGASIHNMLQRWVRTERLAIGKRPPGVSRQEVLGVMTAELDDLKANFNSARYRQGEMMEE